jgi:hypothetical protein
MNAKLAGYFADKEESAQPSGDAHAASKTCGALSLLASFPVVLIMNDPVQLLQCFAFQTT